MDERREVRISDEQFEAIAKRAAAIAREDFYASVGRGVVKAALYVVGTAICSIALWEGARGILKIP